MLSSPAGRNSPSLAVSSSNGLCITVVLLGMNNLADLFAGRADDVWMAVTCARDTDSSGEVEVFSAVSRIDPTPRPRGQR